MGELPLKNNRIKKALVFLLGFLIFALIAYLVVLPFYPAIKFKLAEFRDLESGINHRDLGEVKDLITYALEPKESGNRIIITKIRVDAPIVESNNEQDGLAQGAWRLPESSKPDQGGNTVITGHRFKYLPPSNLTFYLLDKMEAGDIISLRWEEKDYFYRVSDIKIVPASEASILAPSEKSILTLFTCDPIWSETNRLVVVAELI